MKKVTFFLVVCIALLIGCSKDGSTTKTENPAKATIAAQLVVGDSARLVNDGSWEFGQKLFFSKDGKITKLGCRMGNKGSFRVSLWDFATTNLIAATTITVTDTTVFTYNTVADIAVTANTRYVISINTTNGTSKLYWIFHRKSNVSNASIFPFTTGSVTYEQNQYSGSTTSVFPATAHNTYYFYGVPDVQFEYTE